MKFLYYILNTALVAAALVGFTSCDDDDPEIISVVTPAQGNLSLTTDSIRVKIGASNMAALPVSTTSGGLKAFSLNPQVAEIVDVDGVPMIEGKKNGEVEIMISDSGNSYKSLYVQVYTTDQMELSATNYSFELPYGLKATDNGAYVTSGNGGYSIECDNVNVVADIDPETGIIKLTTTVSDNTETGTVTVTDCSGLTATMNFSCTGGWFAYTDGDLEEIATYEKNAAYLDGQTPVWLSESETWWGETTENGEVQFGGQYINYGITFAYGKIGYPEGTKVGEKVSGNFYYGNFQSPTTYNGTVQILVDNDYKRIAVWYNVDAAAKKVSRGYVVWVF